MARLSHVPLQSPRSNGNSFERSSAELSQLLWRLQQTLLHPDSEKDRQLRTSEYERARQGSNLEYARATLTKLEQEALGVLAPGRRAEVQADLNKKREHLDILVDRLQDLHKMAADEEDDEDGDSEVDDVLADIIPTPSDDTDTQSEFIAGQAETATTTATTAPTTTQSIEPTLMPSGSATQLSTQDMPTQTEQSLRARTTAPTSPPPSRSPDNPPSHATARAALFANRRDRPTPTGSGTEMSTATAEAILDAQATEREDIANKVFEMARAMKNQQKNIANSLDTEKDVLGRATEGMERTERGMEVAKGRMGALQRVTEGKGWWGRVILYAWVYGLMLALVLLVFVFPKLRFK